MSTFEKIVTEAVSEGTPLSFDLIYDSARESLPPRLRNDPRKVTNRGGSDDTHTIYTEPWQLDAYIASYLQMHVAKLDIAFGMLPSMQWGEVDVVDWGCGQGLASLYLLFRLRDAVLAGSIREVVLIDPSEVALRRARFLLSLADANIEVRCVNKKLDDVTGADVSFSSGRSVFHLFSNIIDIGGIDHRNVAKLVGVNHAVGNTIVCVSPLYSSGRARINGFKRYFQRPLAFEKACEDGNRQKHKYTYCIWVAGLSPSDVSPVVDCKFYPPVQLRAAYELSALRGLASLPERLTCFDLYAPFDFVSGISDDPHPLLAVLSNVITRGLPTLPSPFIERQFCEDGGVLTETSGDGVLSFSVRRDCEEAIMDALRGGDDLALGGDVSSDEAVYTPLAVARLEKLIVEILLAGRLRLDADHWDVLVEEEDVPCAALAFRDFRQMFETLAAMSRDFDGLSLPAVRLTIITNKRHCHSPLHLDEFHTASPSSAILDAEYDLVIRYSSSTCPKEYGFSKYRAKEGCYFAIYSSESVKAERLVYTSDRIDYKECVRRAADGGWEEDGRQVGLMEYFLRLLFRKERFRPGQLPILSRAMSGKSVIGLLPTGGGKSLTYQLAAMLQPGVTIVVDPLRSLMKDQYDGLRRSGIDACTYINSSVTDIAEREDMMAKSQVLFAFISPERLAISGFRKRLSQMGDLNVYFAYGVIDEVHCVSEWGHDFRFSYLHLGRNLYNYVLPKQVSGEERHLTLFGLTATASFDVLADVERELSGYGAFPLDADSVVRYENTNRLELQYHVVSVENYGCRNDKDVKKLKNMEVPHVVLTAASELRELQTDESIRRIKRRFIEREGVTDAEAIRNIEQADLNVDVHDNWYSESPNKGAAIVFCPHTKGAIGVRDSEWQSGVASALGKFLPSCRISTFVGGDPPEYQDPFIAGETSVMVATKAFGMGIDKPNVRFTFNVGFSSSLEAFVQEAGRAGRDRRMALATILYSGTPVCGGMSSDFNVHKFFYDGNFPGENFEKYVMNYLLSDAVVDVFRVEEDGDWEEESPVGRFAGFMSELLNLGVGESMTYSISYSERDNRASVAELNRKLSYAKFPSITFEKGGGGVKFVPTIEKAIYRMCCVGIVDDYTRDYQGECFRIRFVRRSDDEYFGKLKEFLLRYYAEERAAIEVRNAKERKGNNAIQKCLGYLTDFVYSKVATKRARAIKDIELFCSSAVGSQKDWMETNEDLKDFIYFYFNSKYARTDFVADSGEPFSLTSDSDFGKQSSFDLLFKYMRVVDDDIVGASGSPKDNVKHLQGAVRLIRRSLTDSNPALDLLNVFCLLYLEGGGEAREKELEDSFCQGYVEFRRRSSDVGEFLDGVGRFFELLGEKDALSPEDAERLSLWRMGCEAKLQLEWLRDFKGRYNDI